MSSTRITAGDFQRLADTELPFLKLLNPELVEFESERIVIRARCDAAALRPGGTVSGPVMMGLADAAFYAIILARIGMVKLAVTTSLNINFLRKPGPGDLYCSATILKLGKRLAVCEATLFTTDLGEAEPVAHATGTYSIPPS